MAQAEATADLNIVTRILHHYTEIVERYRHQRSLECPVELLEVGHSLLPAISVNRLWADAAIAILWKQHPDLSALKWMQHDRRKVYASKVEQLQLSDLQDENDNEYEYLRGLEWPRLKSLGLHIDWQLYQHNIRELLHADLESLAVTGTQSGGSSYVAQVTLPALLGPCQKLKRITFGPDTFSPEDPIHASVFAYHLDALPKLEDVDVLMSGIVGKDLLFGHLSKRHGLRSLAIDLDPGLRTLPLFSGLTALHKPFMSLERLQIVCDPEIALALPAHLFTLKELRLAIERQSSEELRLSDLTILDDVVTSLLVCPNLELLEVNVGNLAAGFPTAQLNLPVGGAVLVKLAACCPRLRNIDLAGLDPSSIDGSGISSMHFEDFCKGLPNLEELSLKLHPTTATILQTTALPSLARHCPRLEVLRMGIPLQLLNLPLYGGVSQPAPHDIITPAQTKFDQRSDSPQAMTSTTKLVTAIDTPSASPSTSSSPLFPNMLALSFARPETILSKGNNVCLSAEDDLIHAWSQTLFTHFPLLEQLEAWGDFTGRDNRSMSYILPMEDILEATWEFLSGVEQSLWQDGDDGGEADVFSPASFEQDAHALSPGVLSPGPFERLVVSDWEMASQMEEFRAQ
ncbi:uncharacterized protein M421DRAFT_281875 [Didymella exigua CBS 183.55]|uniref:RNI-like protein n=1 Tax=Didymella exigua CBS 183.55 TaxID=1150837 RepID=A0A6A5RCU0_9PLEO|nr:uncharacterized protein M421DRAFT_281875 [Didymella exigua CBS 183.55]KAF1924406.1 hypothetical protein M421DRAFT_281875 [Didymella exigua CBS 183.55]